MKFIIKFIALMAIGYTIGRTERPIHEMEKIAVGGEGISDFHLVIRYIIGTAALAVMLFLMFVDHPVLKDHLDDLGSGFLAGSVGIGGGVVCRFLLNSLEEDKQ